MKNFFIVLNLAQRNRMRIYSISAQYRITCSTSHNAVAREYILGKTKIFHKAETRTTQSHANIFQNRRKQMELLIARTTQSHANIFYAKKLIRLIDLLAQRSRTRIYSAKTTTKLFAHGLIICA